MELNKDKINSKDLSDEGKEYVRKIKDILNTVEPEQREGFLNLISIFSKGNNEVKELIKDWMYASK